jgi:hypothetical protein
VLIFGGGVQLASTELYNPATGKFSLAANLNTGRTDHSAVLLGNRRRDGCGRLRWENDPSPEEPEGQNYAMEPAQGVVRVALSEVCRRQQFQLMSGNGVKQMTSDPTE